MRWNFCPACGRRAQQADDARAMRCPHCGVIEPAPRDDGVKGMNLMPAAERLCQVCAFDHPQTDPHNATSLYYQTAFGMIHGRAATWADALAHCGNHQQQRWRAVLEERGAWTEPPEGIRPVLHLGLDAAECHRDGNAAR